VWRKWLCIALILFVVLAVGTELFARYYLGLGDPPLCMADPEMVYLFKPNQTCHRFGNLIHYNAYSMRSDDFPAHKSLPNEIRVMVIGDSVINGGALTDQSKVCTSILQKSLTSKLRRPVVIGHISAGGWGPLNQWPFVKKYGLFDADVVVLVFSSHDASSSSLRPTAGIDPNFPDHKPWCATWEAVMRYLPRYFHTLGSAASNEGYREGTADPKMTQQHMVAVKSMINAAKEIGAKPVVMLHWTQNELHKAESETGWRPKGHRDIEAAANEAGASVVDLYSYDEEAKSTPGAYRDDIHLNAPGQEIYSRAMEVNCLRLFPEMAQ